MSTRKQRLAAPERFGLGAKVETEQYVTSLLDQARFKDSVSKRKAFIESPPAAGPLPHRPIVVTTTLSEPKPPYLHSGVNPN